MIRVQNAAGWTLSVTFYFCRGKKPKNYSPLFLLKRGGERKEKRQRQQGRASHGAGAFFFPPASVLHVLQVFCRSVSSSHWSCCCCFFWWVPCSHLNTPKEAAFMWVDEWHWGSQQGGEQEAAPALWISLRPLRFGHLSLSSPLACTGLPPPLFQGILDSQAPLKVFFFNK